MHHATPPVTSSTPTERSDGPCPFRCNRRWREATDAYDKALTEWVDNGCAGPQPEPPQIQPWPGQPIYCIKCGAVIRSALRELPRAYRALASTKYLTRTASADEERRGRSDVPPSPSPGADHQDEIRHTASAWEDDLRRHLGHRAAADTGNPEVDLTVTVEYLNTNWQAMISREECAADFGAEIWRLHATALAMVKNKPVRRHLPSPCPSPGCDTKALIQEEGIAGKPWYVECSERLGGCGRLYSETDWDWFARLITDGHVPVVVTT